MRRTPRLTTLLLGLAFVVAAFTTLRRYAGRAEPAPTPAATVLLGAPPPRAAPSTSSRPAP